MQLKYLTTSYYNADRSFTVQYIRIEVTSVSGNRSWVDAKTRRLNLCDHINR